MGQLRKIAPTVLIVALFFGFSVFAFVPQTARAQSITIIINTDGSISSPVPANITTSDNVTYAFTGNNYLPIVVNRSNIVINGNGSWLEPNSGVHSSNGITLVGVRNVTLKNIGKYLGSGICGWAIGVYAYACSGITIVNNLIWFNNFGIYLQNTSESAIAENSVCWGSGGIVLNSSSNNILLNNTCTKNGLWDGIHLIASTSNVLSGNHAFEDRLILNGSDHNTLYHNIVSAEEVGPDIVLDDSNWNNLTGNSAGLVAGDCIDLISSWNNTLSKNVLGEGAMGHAISLYVSSFNALLGNTANESSGATSGINLDLSQHNVLIGNNVDSYAEGIYVNSSAYDQILGNTLSGNSKVGIEIASSSNVIVSGNNITANGCGVYLNSSSGNSFYHNNFVNNTQQVSQSNSSDIWDNGYLSGGNYWGDYQTRYPSATEIDGSGIWNTPYIIDANNTDNYPLVTPWTGHEVAITDLALSETVAMGGTNVTVNIVVKNGGNYAETFNVTLYGEMLWWVENDTFPLCVFTGVNLTPGSTRVLSTAALLPAFPWGVYLLKAYAWQVPGETDAFDNAYVGPAIHALPSARFSLWMRWGRAKPL